MFIMPYLNIFAHLRHSTFISGHVAPKSIATAIRRVHTCSPHSTAMCKQNGLPTKERTCTTLIVTIAAVKAKDLNNINPRVSLL